ncbi:MAG: hypothetical protein ACFFAU_05465 [Candidatus Hodarchaeota archaeon]
MTLLDHFLREETSYWSIQSLLRKAICRGKWILLFGSRVIAVSETRDEIMKHFRDYCSNNSDPCNNPPGAICVQVGNESKIYRIPVEEEGVQQEENKTVQHTELL